MSLVLLCLLLAVVTRVSSDPCCVGTGCNANAASVDECHQANGCKWNCWFKEITESKYDAKPMPKKKQGLKVPLKIKITETDWKALVKKAKIKKRKKWQKPKQKHKISLDFASKIPKNIESFKNAKDKAKIGFRTFDSQGKVEDAVLDDSVFDYLPTWIKTVKKRRRLAHEDVNDDTVVPYKNVGQVTGHMWMPWDDLPDDNGLKDALDYWYGEYARSHNSNNPQDLNALTQWLVALWNKGSNDESYTDPDRAECRLEWAEAVDVDTFPNLPQDPTQMIHAVVNFAGNNLGRFADPPGFYKAMYGVGTIIAQYPDPSDNTGQRYFICVLTAAHGAWNKVADVPQGKGPNKDFSFRHIHSANHPITDPRQNAQLGPAQFDRAWVPYLFQNREDNSLHGADWSIIRWKVPARIGAFENAIAYGRNDDSPVGAMVPTYRYDLNLAANDNKMMRIPAVQFTIGGYWVYETNNNGDLVGGCSGSPIWADDQIIGVYVGTTNADATSVATRITEEKQFMIARILHGRWDRIADIGRHNARIEYENNMNMYLKDDDYDEEDDFNDNHYLYPQNEYGVSNNAYHNNDYYKKQNAQYVQVFVIATLSILICLLGVIFCGFCGCLGGYFGPDIVKAKNNDFQVTMLAL